MANIHGYKHVRKVNDGRPKPYFGRIWVLGELRQIGGYSSAIEAHRAAIDLRAKLEREARQ
jgi:hypothetical protein